MLLEQNTTTFFILLADVYVQGMIECIASDVLHFLHKFKASVIFCPPFKKDNRRMSFSLQKCGASKNSISLQIAD